MPKLRRVEESEFLFVYVHNKAFRRLGKLCFFAIKEGDLSTDDDDPDLCNCKRSRGILKATIEIGRLAQARLGFLITFPKEGKYNTVSVETVLWHNLSFPLEKGGGFMDAGPERSRKTLPCQDTIHKITLLLEG